MVLSNPKDATEKPSIKEFVLGKALGEGNFSRIIEAKHKATGEYFALKVIEKQRVKRLRLRHSNIYNEINMEKTVLNQLRHPNIVRLYQTFQDEGNLYFLLELLNGGELLNHMLHEGRQLGLDEDLARFYLADVVNAVEYMHANQVLHRDLKPENMVTCTDLGGHLKLVDFGTAKKLAEKKIDGPNFVGTPEYMSPETILNKAPTYASDLWAFGCIVYQLLTGETPFSGGSAYLTFLRVQAESYYMPDYLSPEACDLINQLLQKDPAKRLGGTQADAMGTVKVHPFFQGIDFDNHMQARKPLLHFCGSEFFPLIASLGDADKSCKVRHPLDFSGEDVQDQVKALSPRDRSIVMHILRRKQILHFPAIYPRFFDLASRGRCLYACNRGYVGWTHDLQSQWSGNFSFVQLSGPKLGQAAALAEADNQGGSIWDTESKAFLEAIEVINSQRPAFVVICGEFVYSKPSQSFYYAQVTSFQELLNQISPQICLVFVAGTDEFDSRDEMMKYQEHFGDTRFSFWFGGIKFIVVNTTALCRENEFSEEVIAQTDWIKRELDNGKLCARGTVVISGHSLYQTASDVQNGTINEHETLCVKVLEQLRAEYWEIIRHGQVCLVMSGGSTNNNVTSVLLKDAENEADAQYKCELVSCKMQWGESSNVIHRTDVSQAGVVTKAYLVKSSCSGGVTTTHPAGATDTTTEPGLLTPGDEG